MKKIIISAAIICASLVSHAAAVGWSCAGATGYSSYSVFVIGQNGVTGVDQIKSIVAAGGLDSASSYAFYNGALNNGAAVVQATKSGKSITYGGSGSETHQAFIVVADAAGKKASVSALASISMDNDATSRTFGFNNQAGSFGDNVFDTKSDPQDIPEPTTGVMLLIGVAGLALRRRRA